MRSNLFFAIELPDEAQAAVLINAARWQDMVDSSAAKWYAPEDYHITLKFLGSHEPCEIDAFAGQAGSFVAGKWTRDALGGVPIAISGVGGFPNLSAPRVLWAGVEASAPLGLLAVWLDEACETLGVEAESRAYRPHVTLARVREMKGGTAIPEPPAALLSPVPTFAAGRFVLMQTSSPESRKSGKKLRYNTVHTFDLLGD